MTIGGMNHPRKDPVEEIATFASLGLDFIDFTMEPPAAPSWKLDVATIRKALADTGLGIVGHTAYYLPIGNPFESVRRAAVDELRRCADIFAELGASQMNVHPDRHAPFHDRSFYIAQNLQSLSELIEHARAVNLGIMVENVPGEYNTSRQLADLLDYLPELGLHLDIGHCNLNVKENTASEMIHCYGERIRHVHLHDNNGHSDLHLPLGTGRLDWKAEVRTLKASGYDGTITLEVFSPDKGYLRYSSEQLRKFWEAG